MSIELPTSPSSSSSLTRLRAGWTHASERSIPGERATGVWSAARCLSPILDRSYLGSQKEPQPHEVIPGARDLAHLAAESRGSQYEKVISVPGGMSRMAYVPTEKLDVFQCQMLSGVQLRLELRGKKKNGAEEGDLPVVYACRVLADSGVHSHRIGRI